MDMAHSEVLFCREMTTKVTLGCGRQERMKLLLRRVPGTVWRLCYVPSAAAGSWPLPNLPVREELQFSHGIMRNDKEGDQLNSGS